MALGYRQDHDLGVLAKIEVGGTYEVAHILDDDQVERSEVERLDRALDHVALEMTGASGVDLHRRDAVRADLLGIDAACDIALDHRDVVAVPQRGDGCEDCGGLACSRRSHQVEHEHAVRVEPCSIVRCEPLVAVENRLADVDLQGHSPAVSTDSATASSSMPSSISMLSMVSSLPVSSSRTKLPHSGQTASKRP